MPDAFAGPRLHVVRAQHHISDLNLEVSSFLKSEFYTRVVEPDGTGLRDLHKIRFTRSIDPDLALIAFDAANNLRAALDQASFVMGVGAKHPHVWDATFPFGRGATQFENELHKRWGKVPAADIHAMFRSFKPYPGGNDPLWALNEITNRSKHRELVATSNFVGHSTIINRETGRIRFSNPRLHGPDDEIVLFETPANTQLNYDDVKTRIVVAFDNVSVLRGESAIAVLNTGLNKTQDVIQAIERLCELMGYTV